MIVIISRLLQSLPMDISGINYISINEARRVSGIEYIIYVRKVSILMNLISINVKLRFLMQDILFFSI